MQVSEQVAGQELMEWIRLHIGAGKVPNSLYVWRRGLPRNSNGKILRNLLSQMHRDGTISEGETA